METTTPTDAYELYDMLIKTPNLCGKLKIINEASIEWDLYDNISVSIGININDGYISIDKKMFGKIPDSITHWHPSLDEIYSDLCSIGCSGCVLVIRKNFLWASVLYRGKETDCPYSSTKKWNWGKIYYLKAK